MAYHILAINPGHNGSACMVVDGAVVFYAEEERLSRMKYDGNPFRAMLQCLQTYQVDELVLGGTSAEFSKLPWTMEDAYTALVRKFNPSVKVTNLGHQHHLGHAAGAFYNSGHEEALAVVVDGSGSFHSTTTGPDGTGITVGGYETESVYKCTYPNNFEPLYKRYSDGRTDYFTNGIQEFDNSVTLTKAFEAVSQYLGFGYIEAGKTMGLAPYGKASADIPDFFVEGKGNKNLLLPLYPAGATIDENRYPNLRRSQDPKDWHNDFTKVTDTDKNLAWKVQHETQKLLGDLIESAVNSTGIKNVVIAGGYGLNCVANYYLKGRLKDVNLYVDPVSHDGGTAMGLARLAWYIHSESKDIDALKHIYLGALPNYTMLDNVLNQITNIKAVDAGPADIADLLVAGNIVSLFQGRAEGGPRALGNRSILFDPRVKDGKDIVNRVKGREWFRPFAASVMEEHADEWFDMRGLKSSPFMMYAINVSAKHIGEIPSVTHVDGTCRVQTVNIEDNSAYYELIKSFHAKTGVPMVFNTSFNLAGDPLVETLVDAVNTIMNCNINYLYLPDVGKLLIKE
jgi:carbamoyltransferase